MPEEKLSFAVRVRPEARRGADEGMLGARDSLGERARHRTAHNLAELAAWGGRTEEADDFIDDLSRYGKGAPGCTTERPGLTPCPRGVNAGIGGGSG